MRSPRSCLPADGCGRCRAERAAAFLDLLAAHCEAKAAGGGLLTEAGVEHVGLSVAVARAGGTCPVPGPRAAPVILPHWDPEGRRLWFAGRLLKPFRQPAPRQEVLLAAFEEDGWRERIDDPLPPEPGDKPGDGPERLRTVIRNLNRTLPAGTMRFHADGTGEGVRWARCRPPAAGRKGRTAELADAKTLATPKLPLAILPAGCPQSHPLPRGRSSAPPPTRMRGAKSPTDGTQS